MTDTVEAAKELSPQEYKIELLNIYRKLMEKKLPNVPGDATAVAEVVAAHRAWLANQIESILGAKQEESSTFSAEESQVLKLFAQGLLTKAAKGSPSAQAPEAPAPTKLRTTVVPNVISESDRAIMARARPLKEPGDSAKGGGDLINHLERLQNTKTWMDGE